MDQTVQFFVTFTYMHTKVEVVEGVRHRIVDIFPTLHSKGDIRMRSEKSQRGHLCRLYPQPLLFGTSLPTGLHKSQRGVWECVPPCPLFKMPHSYFHSLHNNWLHGVLSRKSFLVSGAAEVLWRRVEIPPGVGEITKLRYKKNKTVKSCCFNDNFSNFSKGGSCNRITISKGLICGSRII